MPLEMILLLVALLPVIWRVWIGLRMGATVEFRYMIVCVFALLVSMRYWYLVTSALAEYFTADPQYLAAGVCVVLFLVSFLLASVVVNIKAQVFLSVRSNIPDTVLGGVAGLISGAAIACSILLTASVALPGKVENFATSNYPVPADKYPALIFRTIEQNVAHIAQESTGHTLLPVVKPVEGQSPVLTWE